MLAPEVIEKMKTALAAAQLKHGSWRELSHADQMEIVQEEYTEIYQAYIEGNPDGAHGEIPEAIDLMVALCRRIMFLTGELDA